MSLQEVDRLRDRVEELESLLGMRVVCPKPWGLTRREAAVLGLLLKRPLVSRAQFYVALYGSDTELVVEKIIDVLICKLRAKVRPLGLEIRNEFGVGYFMPPESRRRASELIAEHERASA